MLASPFFPKKNSKTKTLDPKRRYCMGSPKPKPRTLNPKRRCWASFGHACKQEGSRTGCLKPTTTLSCLAHRLCLHLLGSAGNVLRKGRLADKLLDIGRQALKPQAPKGALVGASWVGSRWQALNPKQSCWGKARTKREPVCGLKRARQLRAP